MHRPQGHLVRSQNHFILIATGNLPGHNTEIYLERVSKHYKSLWWIQNNLAGSFIPCQDFQLSKRLIRLTVCGKTNSSFPCKDTELTVEYGNLSSPTCRLHHLTYSFQRKQAWSADLRNDKTGAVNMLTS